MRQLIHHVPSARLTSICMLLLYSLTGRLSFCFLFMQRSSWFIALVFLINHSAFIEISSDSKVTDCRQQILAPQLLFTKPSSINISYATDSATPFLVKLQTSLFIFPFIARPFPWCSDKWCRDQNLSGTQRKGWLALISGKRTRWNWRTRQ